MIDHALKWGAKGKIKQNHKLHLNAKCVSCVDVVVF